MNRKSIELKSDEFKYPSREERRIIEKGYPKFARFDFPYGEGLRMTAGHNPSLDEAFRRENLYWWNLSLNNRLGKLHRSYIFSMYHFNRGFDDQIEKCEEGEHINYILFNFYAEMFYYYFISTRDVLVQILNLYFWIEPTNEKIKFITIAKEIPNVDCKNALKEFAEAIKQANEYRNAFAHRFSPREADHRFTLKNQAGSTSIGSGRGDFTPSSVFAQNMKNSLNALAKLMNTLSTLIVL